MNMETREIFNGTAFRGSKIVIVCDGEKHWQKLKGGLRYNGKCHDAGNCPNREVKIDVPVTP
jgi:hypothetical protein